MQTPCSKINLRRFTLSDCKRRFILQHTTMETHSPMQVRSFAASQFHNRHEANEQTFTASFLSSSPSQGGWWTGPDRTRRDGAGWAKKHTKLAPIIMKEGYAHASRRQTKNLSFTPLLTPRVSQNQGERVSERQKRGHKSRAM